MIRGTHSFKDQVRGARLELYEQTYAEIERTIEHTGSETAAFISLSRLVGFLNDNHFDFYRKPVEEFDYRKIADTVYTRDFLSKNYFSDHPVTDLKLDSLADELAKKDTGQVEGIYYYGRALKIGVYRTIRPDSIIGVVLESYLPIWKKGDISFIMKETAKNIFSSYSFIALQKSISFIRNEKFLNGSLKLYGISKYIERPDFINIPASVSKFYSRRIIDDILYIRLGDFMVNNINRVRSEKFYDFIKDSLHYKQIILDLRNNPGGYFSISNPYIKLFRHYAREHQLAIIINHNTVSNGEEFAIKMVNLKNVSLFGETTRGMITYGSNYGRTTELPGKHIFVYPTDMKGNKSELEFETRGVEPDMWLNPLSDWIEQIVSIIKTK